MEDSYVLELTEPKFKDFHLVYWRAMRSARPATATDRPPAQLYYPLYSGGKGCLPGGRTEIPVVRRTGILIEPDTLTFYQADPEEALELPVGRRWRETRLENISRISG